MPITWGLPDPIAPSFRGVAAVATLAFKGAKGSASVKGSKEDEEPERAAGARA